MSKTHLAITFTAPPALKLAIDRAVVRRTVERGAAVSRSQVLCELLQEALRDDANNGT